MTNTFAGLFGIRMPDLAHTQRELANVLDGPFTVVHNTNAPALGAMLHSNLTSVTFVSGSKIVQLDESYTTIIDEPTQTITFTNAAARSEYTIRAIVEEDMQLHYPNTKFSGMEEFKAFLLKRAENFVKHKSLDETPYAVTVDGDEVAALLRRDGDEIARRENGAWVPISGADEDWTDIEDLTWVPVLSGAVEAYDNLGDSYEKLILGDIDVFVV